MKLDQQDVKKICKRVVDHDLDTQFVADQFGVSQRRVQQLAKKYRETGSIPEIETPGRNPYREYPSDLEERVVELHQKHGVGAVAIAHILRIKDDLAIANNKVHEILLENNSVTRNKRKQGRQRPWVGWERDYSLISVHLDWYFNERDEWCLAVEDDASRMILDMIEVESASAEKAVELLDTVRREFEEDVPVLEVITDNGTEFVNSKTDGVDPDHVFEGYLEENGINHTLCKVGRPQTNGKIERFYQTYGKQRWRFDSLDEFLSYYNTERPHMSLEWDELETPSEAFDRLLPTPEELENHLQNSEEVES